MEENKELHEATEKVASQEIKAPGRKKAAAVKVQEDREEYVDPRERRKQQLKDKIEKEREYKSKMVTGKFLFNECPGGELIFHYREFKGDPLAKYVMRHDTIHTIPLGVAMHLNDNCSYPEYRHNDDAVLGKSVDISKMYIMSKVHRTNFIPLDWSLNVGNTSGKSIAQVTSYDQSQPHMSIPVPK
jgi:hypothetical protein